jgi:hypothetical protein
MVQENFKPLVVWLILSGKPEEALELLAKNYKVKVPDLKVGLPKGHKITAFGCYTSKTQTISVLNSEVFLNPFVILHEFYHHLRSKSVDMMHKGTERGADKFALDFIAEYQIFAVKSKGANQ